jgi:hypothetical protein
MIGQVSISIWAKIDDHKGRPKKLADSSQRNFWHSSLVLKVERFDGGSPQKRRS